MSEREAGESKQALSGVDLAIGNVNRTLIPDCCLALFGDLSRLMRPIIRKRSPAQQPDNCSEADLRKIKETHNKLLQKRRRLPSRKEGTAEAEENE